MRRARGNLNQGVALAPVALAALALVSCAAVDDGSAAEPRDHAGGSAPTDGWTFTDDRDDTVTLNHVPTRVAADASSAGGLWEYGIDVDGGVFGEIRRADGSAGPEVGLANPDDFESVGSTTEIDLEQLAAHRPDVIVAAMWSDDEFYGITPEQIDEVEQIAPVIGIRVDERPVTEPLARIAELAESVDRGAASAVDDAKTAFDDTSAALRVAAAAQPDLLIIAASGSATEMYVAYPPAWPDLSYYQQLGVHLIEPVDHATAGGFWQTLSWEEAGTYDADLVLADARGGALEQIRRQMPATALSLPAVAAGQMVAWPAVHAYGYGNFAQLLGDLAADVRSADPEVAG